MGTYEINVRSVLDNFDVFSSPTSTIDPALKFDAANPPSTFVYTASFKLTLKVLASPLADYTSPNNTSPFFLPAPQDIHFYAGDAFSKSFGPAFDNEGNAVTIEAELGGAARFMIFEQGMNQLRVFKNATTNEDVGEYPISITLRDGVTTG